MTEESDLELVEGTGNVFRDLGDPDADLKHAKAILAADIMCALEDSGLRRGGWRSNRLRRSRLFAGPQRQPWAHHHRTPDAHARCTPCGRYTSHAVTGIR